MTHCVSDSPDPRVFHGGTSTRTPVEQLFSRLDDGEITTAQGEQGPMASEG